MGFRFRKSIKLLPGVRLNISKTGVSTSVGTGGATVNLKRGRKPRVTVGIPGSGISYSESISASDASTPTPDPAADSTSSGVLGVVSWIMIVIGIIVLVKIFS
jgi:hypothetical protein